MSLLNSISVNTNPSYIETPSISLPSPALDRFRSIVRTVFSFVQGGRITLDDRYWIERLDHKHRHPEAQRPIFEKWTLQNQHTCSYWDFLEAQDAQKAVKSGYELNWISEKAKENHKAIFHLNPNDPTELRISSAALNTQKKSDGSDDIHEIMYIFQQGNFYIAEELKFSFHHTSLTRGKSVDGAGTFQIKNGIVTKISLLSGHYRPKLVDGFKCLWAIEKMGFDLSDTTIVYFDEKKEYTKLRDCSLYSSFKAGTLTENQEKSLSARKGITNINGKNVVAKGTLRLRSSQQLADIHAEIIDGKNRSILWFLKDGDRIFIINSHERAKYPEYYKVKVKISGDKIVNLLFNNKVDATEKKMQQDFCQTLQALSIDFSISVTPLYASDSIKIVSFPSKNG